MRYKFLTAGIVVLSLWAALTATDGAVAQSKGTDLKKMVDSTITIDRETQKRQEQWASERAELMARYKTAKASVEFLSPKINAAEERLSGVESAIAGLERNLVESKRLEYGLSDTLNTIYGDLESRVLSDLPFLPAERKGRLAALKEDLNKPALSGAEKLRRFLEALQVETGYGNSVEVTQERIALGSDSLFVDLMRIGRISLFWRTTDGERVGEYERATDKWIELPGNYRRDIGLAMDMATRMRPVEIITLPIGRIRP